MYQNEFGDPLKNLERSEANKLGCFRCAFSVKSNDKDAVNGWKCLQEVKDQYPYYDKATCPVDGWIGKG